MIVLINVLQTPPQGLGASYGNFEFVKYGVFTWLYPDPSGILPQTFSGEVEWVNQQYYITQPKLPGAVGYKYWFQPGVVAVVTPRLVVAQAAPNVFVNGAAYNLNSGQGFANLFQAIP